MLAIGQGTINTTGLNFLTSGGPPLDPGVSPAFASEFTGSSHKVAQYIGASGPTSFGPGPGASATTGSGDLVGIISRPPPIFGPGSLIAVTTLPSSPFLFGEATYAGQTLSSLGLTPGVYTYTWGSGANADSFIVAVAGVPEPASAALFGTGLLSISMLRLRRRS
ncbi:MAG: PEP-CTERM sorting domain-containing protein [Acetobacteraceae bacterium]|nr:PEP-CTERM sorting domain-containing protein [Acetobacteraceae bacterium]